jgi:hypothetical protein
MRNHYVLAFIVLAVVFGVIIRVSPKEKAAILLKYGFSIDVTTDLLQVYNDRVILSINKTLFIEWLVEQDRLSWIDDYNDPRQPDGHGQRSGVFSIDEYFEGDEKEIYKDMKIYLKRLA